MKPKAIVLFSNGLDSRLVVMMLKDQLPAKNITALYFLLPFGSRYPDPNKAKEFCKKQKINFKLINCTKGKLLQEYLNLIRKPKHGYGKALNPCIDCKIWILNKARIYAEKNKIPIIATGEVLGERPKSQHKSALLTISKQSNLKDNILRPLSAKLLPETQIEKDKLIDREKLLDIQGRKREKQLKLAKKYKIDYPSPGGGCLLCEPRFCKKLKPYIKNNLTDLDIELFKIGRSFENNKIILGKNEKENKILESLYKKHKGNHLIISNPPGPTAFVRDKTFIPGAKKLMKKYFRKKIKSYTIT